ncbi:hypothetical protein [Tateyamaria sp. ANG-S1]|uniref:hypothetical protein n=1 Tax=Tateyamaria sp. ANG-S1 TaxID=1577905 RepID=UPI00068AF5F5|nr:hypothetical protein [Tateyamaria sp. ANG-S1]
MPYVRFRDTHLAHHQDANLTDPYDEFESNCIDPAVWRRMPVLVRALLRVNNTLAGRMIVWPLVGQTVFMRDDWRAVRVGH